MGFPTFSAIAPRHPFLLFPLALCLLLPPVALLVPSAIAAPPAQTPLGRQEKAQLQEKANRLAMLAVSLSRSSLPATSSAFYEEALQIFQRIGDYTTAVELLQAMGGTARNAGQLQEAIAAYQRALAIYQGPNLSPIDRYRKSGEVSEILIILGELHQAAGQFDRAQDAYQRALASGKLKDRYGGEAIAFNKLGTLYRLMNKPEQALAAYQKALVLYEEVGGDIYEEPRVLNRLGLLYQSLGQFGPAAATYQKALTALNARLTDFNRVEVILTLENLLNLYQAQGQVKQAEVYTQRAAVALETLAKDPILGDRREVIAEALSNIGYVYLADGQVERAENYFQRALAIAGLIPGEYPELNLMSGIELAYRQQGRLAETLPYQQRTIVLYQKMELPENTGTALWLLGQTYQAIGQLESALDAYERSRSVFEKMPKDSGSGDADLTLLLQLTASVYAAQGQWQSALAQYQKALEQYQKGGFYPGQSQVLESMGQIYAKQGSAEQAQKYYQQAVEARRQMP